MELKVFGKFDWNTLEIALVERGKQHDRDEKNFKIFRLTIGESMGKG